ncbi:MAG: DUF3854 domain-containing protein, partial [Polyangiales bacterium]
MSTVHNPTSESVNTTAPVLWKQHVELLSARGIPADFAVAHGLRSIDVSVEKARIEKYRLPDLFPHLPMHEGATGLLIPYHATLDKVARARIRVDQTSILVPGPTDGSHVGDHTVDLPRYVCQARPVSVVPYIPSEVFALAGDTSVPLFVVEAPLKALSLTANGFPAIGLGGVLAGATDKTTLDSIGKLALSKEMQRIKWTGRIAYVAFDAGLADNPLVALGAARLALGLQRAGADVRLVTIPFHHGQDAPVTDAESFTLYSKTDQGPDDFVARKGVAAFKLLVGSAVSADPIARVVNA